MIKDFWLTPCDGCIIALNEISKRLSRGENVKVTVAGIETSHIGDLFQTHIEINEG